MNDFVQDYRTLGLVPGCTMQSLKAARRRLVIAWHPDRFPGDTGEKTRAEERIKDINTAFDRLLEYHRRFGALPVPTAASPAAAAVDVPVDRPKPRRSETPIPEVERGRKDASQSTRIRTSLRWAIAIVIIILFNESMHTDYNDSDDSDDSTSIQTNRFEDSLAEGSADIAPSSPVQPSTRRAFAVGSTIDDVYAAQGRPTSTQNGVWYYGKSKVYFADGLVTGWDVDPANPLNTALSSDVLAIKTDAHSTFTVGSTEAEVRAIQGVPFGKADNRWDYGPSKVYFRDGRVVSWTSSPTHPLKAKK